MLAPQFDKILPVEILLVDDNPGDIRLTQEAIKRLKVVNRLHMTRDGVEALAFLRHEKGFEYAPRPHMILLDLNMPRMGGAELLETIKTDTDLKSIPVVILTSSDREDDIQKSYDLHANCYLTKPVDLKGLNDIVEAIDNFWFTVVELPQPSVIR